VTANEALKAHYDQAWSLAHYLLHAGGGKHREALVAFVKALAAGDSAGEAWRAHFPDPGGFEKGWRQFWLDLPDDATPDVYATAAVQTLATFRGRAAAAGRQFHSFEGFLDEAEKGRLKFPPEQWLPPSLVAQALEWAPKGSKWADRPSGVSLALPEGSSIIADYTVNAGRGTSVDVRVVPKPD
jgi:hypothetical protein